MMMNRGRLLTGKSFGKIETQKDRHLRGFGLCDEKINRKEKPSISF